MVFISMSLTLSLSESIDLYKSFIDKLIPNMFLRILGIEGNLYKNGKRKKAYYINGKKYYFQIQRMVYNKYYYFDLFPIFLLPNSTMLTEDVIELRNDKYVLSKRRLKTIIEEIIEVEDIYNLTTFDIIYRSINISIYRSREKYLYSFRRKRNNDSYYKKYIFIIYLHSSAQTTFS